MKTYNQILKLAKQGQLNSDDFDNFFKPLSDEFGVIVQYDCDKASVELLKSELDKRTDNNQYRYVWTCVDGEEDDLLLLNGWHVCNRLFYIICETPWGDGSKKDAELYIEAIY